MQEENLMAMSPKDAMKSYATIRLVVEELNSRLKEMVDKVKQSEDYKTIEDWLMINKISLEELTKQIHQATIDAYEATGNKKPFDGVGIREVTKYDYEEKAAVEWAKANMPAILTVDKKKFEKVISVMQESDLPEYIKVYKQPQPTISADLSMYLVDTYPVDGEQPEDENKDEVF